MVYVVFVAGQTGQPPEYSFWGPYDAVDLTGGGTSICVMEGLTPLVLATQDGDNWQVHDGLGHGGSAYHTVLFLSRRRAERLRTIQAESQRRA
jgi:hypothetical protein